ncbi:peptidoglycan-binding protein [Candidatus Kaiserbacteria bacterium]|nr:peptidoglycan-binding protein [Candidatus Kaiserbacteria bacterium]
MSKALATKNVAAVFLGLGLILALSFAFATPAKAQTIADLQVQIQALLAQIAALQGGTTTGGTGAGCYTFTRNHSMGNSGGEVMWIQTFLNAHGAVIASAGAGSPGNETSYFGARTKAAVSAFQAANGITPAAGFWGPITRAKANALCAGVTPGPVTPGTPPPVPVGAGLRAMLAADNPAASTIVKSQGIALLAKFTFSNGSGVPVTVTNLALKRIGVSTDTDLSNIYLYDGARRITDPAGISSGNFSFNASGGLFTVPANGSVTVSVRSDIGSTNGNQVGVQLTGVTASAPLDASVVLPISGNLHLISNATIATATWGTATPSNVTFAPANEITVFQATLTENTRAAWLHSVQFENRGTTKDSDFANFKLYVKGNPVGSVVPASVGDKVIFDLSANPLKLETGGNEIRLVADVLGTSGKTFDFQIRRGTDILLVDSELGQPLKPSAPTAVTANTVEGIGLSVVKANTSPTENVAVASTGQLWSRFEFRAAGDDVKVEAITVDIDTSTSDNTMDNVRIMLDGVQVGSTADVTAAAGTSFTLGSSMILKLGKTHVVEIYGDSKQSDATNYTATETVDVGVSIATADTEGIASGDRLTSAISEVEGNSRTISSSTLTGTKASGYGNQTIVAGANNAKLGSFTLGTGSTEGVTVNTIVINLSTAEAASITDLRLVDNATGAQIGTTKSSAAATNSFGVNVPMGASQTKTINVVANVKSGANAGPWIADLDDTSGGTGATTGQSVTVGSDVSLQTITNGSGTLTVTRGSTSANSTLPVRTRASRSKSSRSRSRTMRQRLSRP